MASSLKIVISNADCAAAADEKQHAVLNATFDNAISCI